MPEPAPSTSRAQAEIGSATATGPRPDNQDRCAFGPGWAVVCDGMGGHRGGARAAELAVAAASQVLGEATGHPAAVVLDAIRAANDAVRAGQEEDRALSEMGATVTVVGAAADGRWHVANLGDSPAWLVRPDETVLLTEAHNLAGELVRRGALDPADAADHPGSHMLLAGAGLDDDVRPTTRAVAVAPGERLVLASDGLAEGLDPSALHRLLADDAAAEEEARRLVDAAVDGGTGDNVTVVVIRPGAG